MPFYMVAYSYSGVKWYSWLRYWPECFLRIEIESGMSYTVDHLILKILIQTIILEVYFKRYTYRTYKFYRQAEYYLPCRLRRRCFRQGTSGGYKRSFIFGVKYPTKTTPYPMIFSFVILADLQVSFYCLQVSV